MFNNLIVSLVFSHLGFWSGNLFLIAPFPDLCLLLPFFSLAAFAKLCGSLKRLKYPKPLYGQYPYSHVYITHRSERSSSVFLFAITAAGVVPCGDHKMSPKTSLSVPIMFSFWSFEDSEGILKNQRHYRFRLIF